MSDVPSLTLSVPEAGRKYFGLSRNAAYAAAVSGEIPTIRIGKLLRVPVRAMERLLDSAGAVTKLPSTNRAVRRGKSLKKSA